MQGFSSYNIHLLEEIKTWLAQYLKKTGYIRERIKGNHRCCQLIIGGNLNFVKITNLLYYTNCICLDRKLSRVTSYLQKIQEVP